MPQPYGRALLLAVVLVSSSLIKASPPARPGVPPVSPAERYRPSPVPDRIVLTWNDDPRTTQAVTWRTSGDVNDAVAEIAVARANPGLAQAARRVAAETTVLVTDHWRCHYHTATFTNLKPGTLYAYRVGDGANFSEWFQFRTAADEPAPFSFIYFGDAQNHVHSMCSRVFRQAFADAPRAAFTLHAGDLIDLAESDAEWGEWFAAAGWINAMVPVVATPGNHEYAKARNAEGKRYQWLSRHWAAQFAYPVHGPDDLAESVYCVDYQNLRVISLNSNERQAEQIPWIEKALTDNPQTWTVITFHHPIFSMARDRDNPQLRELWKPVFDRHAVDLVLTGHDHTYGRSGLLHGPASDDHAEQNVASGTNYRSADSGTVYVVSVSGPKMYNLDPSPPIDVRRRAEDTQLYQVITIDGPKLRYEARTATGELYDAFTLTKQPGQANTMTEHVPDRPEYRRSTKP